MKKDMDSDVFYKALHQQYGGSVVAVERYINPRAIMRFHCTACDMTFYNRPYYVLSVQQHKCFLNYADDVGYRAKTGKGIKADKTKKRLPADIKKEISGLFDKGVSISQISRQLSVSVGSVLYYLSHK